MWLCEAGSSLLTGPEGLSAKERDDLKKLKALRRYRRRYGVEALLHRRLRERRQAVSEGAPQVALHLLTPHTHTHTPHSHLLHSPICAADVQGEEVQAASHLHPEIFCNCTFCLFLRGRLYEHTTYF